MPHSNSLCELTGDITLGRFREYTALMPDDAIIAPRFLDAPSDEEPGVALIGIGKDDYNGVPVVSLAVELFYLDELDAHREDDCEDDCEDDRETHCEVEEDDNADAS